MRRVEAFAGDLDLPGYGMKIKIDQPPIETRPEPLFTIET
jgi:hypothetical protein